MCEEVALRNLLPDEQCSGRQRKTLMKRLMCCWECGVAGSAKGKL